MAETNNTIFFVMSIDIDEDNFDKDSFPSIKTIAWKGVEEGIPLILRKLNGYKDSTGKRIRYTWFVRCDKQLEILYNDPTFLFKEYREFWEDAKLRGDEIGWHPHLYDHSPEILNDEEQLIKDLNNCFTALNLSGFKINSSRIGRAFCSNTVMRTLNEMGIKVDSTAMPGRKKKDKFNFIDWEITPQLPFYPSKFDYRARGKIHFDLLEIPMSMIKTKVSYDIHPIKRYANLTFKNSLIKDPLRNYIQKYNLLITIMHPSEVVIRKKHPLLSFDIGEVERNLDFIISESNKVGKSIKFVTVAEILSLAKRGLINVARN